MNNIKLAQKYHNAIDDIINELNLEIRKLCDKYNLIFKSGMGSAEFTINIDCIDYLKEFPIDQHSVHKLEFYTSKLKNYYEDEQITIEQYNNLYSQYSLMSKQLHKFIKNCLTLQTDIDKPYLLSWCSSYKGDKTK